MKELLLFILESITDHKEELEVREESEDTSVTLTIAANAEDKGRIIGKGGRNIKAIRQILSIIARTKNQHVFIRVE